MTNQELRRLGRSELLELLIAQMKENEALAQKLEQANAELSNREIALYQAGSIAEAALSLNGVFDAAQAAAAQYLENIQRLSNEQDAICRQMEAEARAKADEIRAEADAYSQKVRSDADNYRRQVLEEARSLLGALLRGQCSPNSLTQFDDSEMESLA